MTSQIEVLAPVVDGSPGSIASGRVGVFNDSPIDAVFTIQVVGLDTPTAPTPTPTVAVQAFTVSVGANSMVECTVPVPIPVDIPTGQHAAAFQATTDQPGDRPMLAPFTLSIESVEHVNMYVDPVPIHGRRRARFVLGISNDEPTPVSFTVDAEATDVRVKFKNTAFRLLPGQRTATKARVRGPRAISGEPIQHNLVITAKGKAAATTITTPFVQRPMFAHRAHALVAGLAVIALWLAAIGGVALWVSSRNDSSADEQVAAGQDAALVQLMDANGDVLDNGPYTALADGSIVDADGNVVEGFTVDENGNVLDEKLNPVNGVVVDPATGTLVDIEGTPIGLPPDDPDGDPNGDGSGGDGTTADGGSGSGGDGNGTSADGGDGSGGDSGDLAQISGITAPTSTLFNGSVAADGTSDLSDVSIKLIPIDLGRSPRPDATVIDPPSQNQSPIPDQTSATKLWSARFAAIGNGLSAVRQTTPVSNADTTADENGLWRIPNVALRQTYELAFAKPGFDTQSFVVSPPDDGSFVTLDVTLEPAEGVIAGRVFDGNRPLGGVEVALSDGTLTFTTTSATDGDVGAFTFEGVSTPNVYTLVATLNGYGTEVVQLPMDAGQQRPDVNVSMSAGVATVSGSVVDESGRPLGGVTVTASNGEITRTTNTLTEGNTGFYSIPQLEIPGTYTITAEFDGYVRQTRRIPVNGSIGGVSFALVGTTAELTGVVSSANGGGIVGARVSLSNADLEFEISTAAAPRAGAFLVDQLPPGIYTVTVSHFEHDTITELIEIVAGEDPAPLNLTMPVRTTGIDAGTGSLVVEVVDPAAEEADEREVRGATVRLITTRTGVELVSRTDPDSFTFEFSDIPVGTYTILVSAPLFNDAAPRTVSIGRSQERRTIEMAAFGAASGSMIDSITGEVIKGYTVKFFEQDAAGGAEREIGPAEVNVAASGEGSWATAPRVLPTGRYRLEVTGASGYQEPATQILTPGLPPMQFDVQLNSGQATEIPTLVADRYPDIFGRVYEPLLIGGSDATNTGTRFLAIDEPSLSVGMRCNDGPLVPMIIRNEFGTVGGDEFDAFFLSRQAVDANNLIGSCEIEISADGYVTATTTLPNVAVSDGITLSDRVVTAAIHKPVDPFGGRVFWVDPRFDPVEIPLPDVDIFADAITSLTSTDDSPIPTGAEPSESRTRIETTSDADGNWALDGQVFGGARYTFREFGFQDGIIDVVIDESRTRTITDISGVDITRTGDVIAVELEPPNEGLVFGRVTIESIDTKQFDEVGITATDPFNNAASDVPSSAQCTSAGSGLCILRTNGDFRIEDAAAGTWTVDFEAPENHILFGGATDSVEQRVEPQGERGGFDTAFVELGELDVELIRAFDDKAIDADVTLRFNGRPDLDTTFTGGDGPDGNIYSTIGIPVSPTTPTTTATPYTVNVVVPGFDQATSKVFINNVEQVGVRSNAIPLTFFAGSKPQVRIELEGFGLITTSALGVVPQVNSVPAEATEVLRRTAADPEERLTVTFQKVDQNGAPDTVGNALAGLINNTDGSFSISGPDGWYEISVTHPQFEQFDPEVRPSGGTCFREPFTGPPPTVTCTGPLAFITPSGNTAYRLQNNTDHVLQNEFRLDIRRSEIELSVFESLDTDGPAGPEVDGPAVADAQFRLLREDGPGNWVLETDGTQTGDIDATGMITITTIPRTLYRLEVIGDAADRFPAIVEFPLERSISGTTSVVRVRTPLPKATASISGFIAALNDRDDPVPLPQFDVDIDYAEPQIQLDGVERDNLELSGDGPPLATTPLPGGRASFLFSNRAVGDHTLTFPSPAGYTPTFSDADAGTPGTQVSVDNLLVAEPRVASPVPNVAGDFEYDVASYTTLTMDVARAGNSFPTLEVKLVYPLGDPNGTVGVDYYLGQIDPGDDLTSPVTVTFVNVPPHIDDYRIIATDALHITYDASVPVPVDTDGDLLGTLPTIAPVATGANGRVAGFATQSTGGASVPTGFDSQAEVCLLTATESGNPTADEIECKAGTSEPTGAYFFDNVPGPYRVQLKRPGYSIDTKNVTIVAGQIDDQDLGIVQRAIVEITLSPFTPTDAVVTLFRKVNSASDEPFPTTLSGGVFTATVPADDYRVSVSGGGIAGFFDPPNGNYFDVSAGPNPVQRTVVVPRTLQVTLNGNNSTSRTVEIFDEFGASVSTTTQTNRVFNLSGAKLPATGDVTVVARRTGRRTDRAVVAEAFADAITLNNRELVELSGKLVDAANNGVGGATITATASDGSTVPVAVTNNSNGSNRGDYTFPDLTNSINGTDVTYTFTATVDGKGVLNANNTEVIQAHVPTGNSIEDRNFVLVPRTNSVQFTVTRPGGVTGPFAGGQIAISGQKLSRPSYGSMSLDDNGQATFSILEDEDALTMTVTSDLYQTLTNDPITAAEVIAGSATRAVVAKTVTAQFTVSPAIQGIEVKYTPSGGSEQIATTNGSGVATFANVPVTLGSINWTAGATAAGDNGADDYPSVPGTLALGTTHGATVSPPTAIPMTFIAASITVTDSGTAAPPPYILQYCAAIAATPPAPPPPGTILACGTDPGNNAVALGTTDGTGNNLTLPSLPADGSYRLEALIGTTLHGSLPFTVTNRRLVEARPLNVPVS